MSRINRFYIILLLFGTSLLCSIEMDSYSEQSCTSPEKSCFKSLDQNRTEYIAAVVEYQPIPIADQTAANALLSNVKVYVKIIEDANRQKADIIVFPEYGITTIELPSQRDQAREYLVHVPPIGSNPCNESYQASDNFMVLHELSCAAKRYKIYVVVNLGELDECGENIVGENCSSSYHYNTNVVFDRNGTIIARYRKFHLYFEPQFDYPQLEFSTFKTDFGVEFGLFTCFDIIFSHPAVELAAVKGIRNFVFPTAWVDELPFLTAIQAQSLWAQSNGANLLASGYHQPDRGSMGSGIYSGYHQGALNYVYDPNSGTKLIFGLVPIFPESQTAELRGWQKPLPTKVIFTGPYDRHFWLREDLSNYTFKTLDQTLTRETLCYHDRFCCQVEYEIQSTPETTGQIKLVVFDDKRTVAAKRDWFEWQLCAIIYCLNETLESCTENIDTINSSNSHPKIEKLSIRMQPLKLEYADWGVAKPALSLLDTSFNLIPQTYFEIDQGNDTENGISYAQVTTKSSTNIADLHIKTVALIQKVFNGRL